MGHETISAITGNIESILKGIGLNVTRKPLDALSSLPAGLMPLAQVFHQGESFESCFGERPGYSEASCTIKIILPSPHDCVAPGEEQMWGHQVRDALTAAALNAGELASMRPVTAVNVAGFRVECGGSFSKVTVELKIRYRES